MTISDEVRAEHRKGIEFPHECGDCGEPWPCAAIRLADSHDGLLAAAENVKSWWFEDGDIDMDKVCAAIAGAKGETP